MEFIFNSHFVLILIVAASILLMLVRPRGVAEVYWVGAGAMLLVLWKELPRGEPGDLIKLIVFAGTLAFMGTLAWRGELPRTRPILPGEYMVD